MSNNDPVAEYRQAVRGYLIEHQTIEDHLIKFLLQQKAQELNLSEPQAREIQQAEINNIHQAQKRVKKAQQQYQNLLTGTIAEGKYPFSQTTIELLKQAQQVLNLTDSEVEEISQAILAQAEAEYKFKSQIKSFSFKVITVNEYGQETSRKTQQARFFREDLGNGVELEMVAIPGGEFLMGTEEAEIERLVQKFNWEYFRREKPQHRVKIQPFFLGRYPVTQAQWQAIMGNNPARFTENPLNPVERVSWEDAVEFCQRLSEKTGKKYRLPSEAEWEYAGRAVVSHQSSVISHQ